MKKKQRQKQYMTILVNGKQNRVKRPPQIDGMDVDEFIRLNAGPIWLHQNEMREYMDQSDEKEMSKTKTSYFEDEDILDKYTCQ